MNQIAKPFTGLHVQILCIGSKRDHWAVPTKHMTLQAGSHAHSIGLLHIVAFFSSVRKHILR